MHIEKNVRIHLVDNLHTCNERDGLQQKGCKMQKPQTQICQMPGEKRFRYMYLPQKCTVMYLPHVNLQEDKGSELVQAAVKDLVLLPMRFVYVYIHVTQVRLSLSKTKENRFQGGGRKKTGFPRQSWDWQDYFVY